MDLLSLILTLRPLPSADPTKPLPLWWGRAAHRLLLSLAQRVNPALAEALHEAPGPRRAHEAPDPDASSLTLRPFTVSTLRGRFPHGVLAPESAYTLRLTALTADLAAILNTAAGEPGGGLHPGSTVELDYIPFQVEGVSPVNDPDPGLTERRPTWAGSADYAALAAALLPAKQPVPRRVTLQFASPTTFKSAGKHVPIPMPELVFGSLLERWNAFAPITFPPETKRYAAECLAISRYELSSRSVPGKSGSLRMGGVGEVTYTTLNYDRYWMSVIAVLAEFAIYSGAGAGTANGLGQCRRVAAAE